MAENRRFIRHPSDIPIEFSPDDDQDPARPGTARDVSFGGLAFE